MTPDYDGDAPGPLQCERCGGRITLVVTRFTVGRAFSSGPRNRIEAEQHYACDCTTASRLPGHFPEYWPEYEGEVETAGEDDAGKGARSTALEFFTKAISDDGEGSE